MWVESEEGAGACFSFTLPVARDQGPAMGDGMPIRSGAKAP
jgi:hypothetical protein